ncbi:response regulator transcription factor [Streptomyces sp. NPDC029004]|uniref:response regulator transcription factor n=1 Tax=Streptomyces sp. NPDC029004 TaxID=3154490 RepID=UPI003411B97C
MPDDSSYTPGQQLPSSHVSQHTSSHSTPIRSEHTPAQVPLPPPAAASGGFPALPAPVTPTPLRIVVADDNPVVRAGLHALLSGREDIAVVAEAADGRQACEAAQQHRPHVVLLDVRMPGVDGISALPHLVRIAPVMMLTYSRESEIVHEALRLGAGGYLVHGEFTADQLVEAVRDIRQGRAHFTVSAANALLAHVRGERAPSGPQQLPGRLGQQGATAHGSASQTDPRQTSNFGHQDGSYVSNSLQPQHNASRMQSSMGQSLEARQAATPRKSTQRAGSKTEFGLSSREVEVMDLIASGMTNQQIAATCFISEKTVKNHINRIFAKLHSTSRSEAIAVWLGTAHGHSSGGMPRGAAGHG